MTGSVSHIKELADEAARLEREGRPADAAEVRKRQVAYEETCRQIADGLKEFNRACGSKRHS